MNTLLIQELLEPFGICQQTGDPMNVHEVLLFENGAPDADDMAYVTCGAESKGRYRHALIIAIGETAIASTHMIQLAGGSVSGVMNCLIRALRRLERLNDALYAASNSQEVIDIASQKTRLPFFYFDDSYRIIAISRKIYYVIDEEWRHMTEKGFLSPGTVRLMRENGDLDYLAATDEPIIYDSELFPFVCAACNIKFHNHFVGRINILIVDRDARQEHLEICRIVHAHLYRLLREGKTPDGDIRLRKLLTEILNEKNVQSEMLQAVLQGTGTDPKGGFQVFIMDINASEDPQLYNYYARLLEQMLPGFRFCILPYEGNLLLLAILQSEPKCAMIQEKIKQFLQIQQLRCGVSQFYHAPEQLRGYYEQALFALNKAPIEKMVLYENVLMDRFFAFIPDRHMPFMLSNDFLSLLDADRSSSFPMVDTLKCYLENGRNLIRTAEVLSIHKNTMLYRLNRIREFLNIDEEDFNVRVALDMSFLLWNRIKNRGGAVSKQNQGDRI